MSNSIIAATLLALSAGAHTYAIAPPVPAMVAQQAQPAGTTFYADRGEGLFRISGRSGQKVALMSIAIDPQKVVDINMHSPMATILALAVTSFSKMK